MQTVTSKDGTPIAFDRSGAGPPVILVGGALSDRSGAAPLAAALAPHFTVFAYDRRGRGDSGDTPPYAVEREVEDIEALIVEAGGVACLFGQSSGAALALEAAGKLGAKVEKLALYEPPFFVDDSRAPVPPDYTTQLGELLAAGRRGDAVAYFMTVAVEVPAEMVAQMRNQPIWAAMEALAHTLPYDNAVMGDTMAGKPLPKARWATATMPTLVLDGGDSPAWMHHAAQAVADALPDARRRTLPGQGHGPAPEVLAPLLVKHFKT
jgi:pimeloyl-ACP methyl ester carboxylesterase